MTRGKRHTCVCGSSWRWRLDYLEHLTATGHEPVGEDVPGIVLCEAESGG